MATATAATHRPEYIFIFHYDLKNMPMPGTRNVRYVVVRGRFWVSQRASEAHRLAIHVLAEPSTGPKLS